MNIKELRIGNIVERPTVGIDHSLRWGKYDRVAGIHGAVLFASTEQLELISFAVERCAGVALTERVLEKVGFSKENYSRGCMGLGDILDPFILEPSANLSLCDWVWVYSEGGREFKQPVRYLHDLQNLYFMLTREELKFELFQNDEL